MWVYFHYRYFGLQAGEGTDENNPLCMWWHTKLADFFEHEQNLERKVEVCNTNQHNLTLVIVKHKCRLLDQLVCCKYACVVHLFDCGVCMYYMLNDDPVTSSFVS